MAAPRSTGTKSRDRTWKSVVAEADPDFEAQKRREVEYDFSGAGRSGQGRVFTANRDKRFPYDQADS